MSNETLSALRAAEMDLKHLLDHVDGRLVSKDRIYQTTLAMVQAAIRTEARLAAPSNE